MYKYRIQSRKDARSSSIITVEIAKSTIRGIWIEEERVEDVQVQCRSGDQYENRYNRA